MADNDVPFTHIDQYGIPLFNMFASVVAIEGMLAPVRCKWCHQVHDSAKVEVLQRYSDCSVWKCPNCGTRIDDRPESLGGSAIPIKE